MILIDGGPEGYQLIKNKMDNSEVTAAWARNQAETILSQKVQKQIDEVIDQIKIKVLDNQLKLDTTINLHELTKKELVRRGFTFKYYEGDSRDQTDSGYYTISW